MRIIGIDPGYAIVGWGVLSYENSRFVVLGYGAITTEPGLSFSQRLLTIYLKLTEILKYYCPLEMAVEKLFFNSNQKTAIEVAQARGVLLLAAEKNGLRSFEYTPIQVKKSVTGYGRATKNQVISMATKLLNLKSVPKPDDVADALAVAVAHAHSGVSRLFRLRRVP